MYIYEYKVCAVNSLTLMSGLGTARNIFHIPSRAPLIDITSLNWGI